MRPGHQGGGYSRASTRQAPTTGGVGDRSQTRCDFRLLYCWLRILAKFPHSSDILSPERTKFGLPTLSVANMPSQFFETKKEGFSTDNLWANQSLARCYVATTYLLRLTWIVIERGTKIVTSRARSASANAHKQTVRGALRHQNNCFTCLQSASAADPESPDSLQQTWLVNIATMCMYVCIRSHTCLFVSILEITF